jgi:hypothetical protein
MMGAGEQEQVVAGQSFAARIAGMGLHGQLRLSQPTAQGFAINGKQTATFGQSDQGHRTTPFVLQVTRTTVGREHSRQFSWALQPHLFGESLPEGTFEEKWFSLSERDHL